jgi:hypothetical protein
MEAVEKQTHALHKAVFAVLLALALLVGITSATYAWFSINHTVGTDSVRGRSGTDSIELLVSSSPYDFAGDEATLTQVNEAAADELLPVSTADLVTFVYNPITIDDMASTFTQVENESLYYHGRIYLQAVATGQSENARLALYFDQDSSVGGELAQTDDNSLLLNAARLGLTFDDEDAIIFRLSEDSNTLDDQAYNTVIDGVTLGDGQVLDASGGSVQAVEDPSVLVEDYTIVLDGTTLRLPQEPLYYLPLNQTVTVDVYFYLEGCDPDCSDSITLDEAALHLAFYGILVDGEANA